MKKITVLASFALFVELFLFGSASFGQQTTGPETFGGRLERPSRAKVRRIHAEAVRKLAGITVPLPKSQNQAALARDRNATATPDDPKFSWRPVGIITPARDQSTCGSCYVFGAIAAFESNWALRHPNEQIDSSEQKVFNCVPGGCSGGLQSDSTAHLISRGTCSEVDLPYVAVKNPCVTCPQRYKGTAWDWVSPTGGMPTRKALKEAILRHGPVTTFIYAAGFGDFYNTDRVVNTNSHAGPHIVSIVGWDDTKTYQGGVGAWEIKNSWGPTWGRDGIGFVAYGVRSIGNEAIWIETIAP
jgi:C1A family cysteine protease